MANQRQPIQLIQAKGKKHLTKSEIEQRQNSEIKPQIKGIRPPKFLTKTQRKRFNSIAKDLMELEIMGKTDCDALARYVIVEELFEAASEALNNPDIISNPEMMETATFTLEKYFKMCRSAAGDLGLTISSRCKLVVPKAEGKPPENKFNKFVG